jgi:hypothetical protein
MPHLTKYVINIIKKAIILNMQELWKKLIALRMAGFVSFAHRPEYE